MELKIPEEIPFELSREEVVLEILGEVLQDRVERIGVLIPQVPDISMEEREISVIGVEKAVEDPCVLLSEGCRMKLVVGDSLGLLF